MGRTEAIPKPRIVEAQGSLLWDDSGGSYVDLGASLGVALVGHRHPAVMAAMGRQAKRLVHLSQGFRNDARDDFRGLLASVAPVEDAGIIFSNSGAEAVEVAIKVARAVTGRPRLVAAYRGFHGRTTGALSLTFRREYREPFGPLLQDVGFVPYDDREALAAAVDSSTAAVFLEPLQGEGGVHVPSPGYLREALAITRDAGALLVLDEVQTGLGRTGRLFACEADGISPDILCLSKGLGGGLPLGATFLSRAVAGAFRASHGSTLGGNPLACAAGRATLEVILEGRLWERAGHVGARWVKGLRALPAEAVRHVRGRGLMLAAELRSSASEAYGGLASRGYLPCPANGPVLRFLPPLTIEEPFVDGALEALEEVLAHG
jgi:acetylornithine/LysW-gamma-L-lysine aminotransferase